MATQGKRVVVVGAGGNIGSHLAPHLARIPGLKCLTLIDRDSYEERNLASQDITPRDAGKIKVRVQAAKLRTLNPSLEIEALHAAFEDVPVGMMKGDVIVACVDSREARRHVNRIAFRLGVPWVDAGVQSTALLARVNVYRPSEDGPCYECSWNERDYELLHQEYSCDGGPARSTPTDGVSALGALAASMQSIEVMKILDDRWEDVCLGQQIMIDAQHHHYFRTSYRRNPACRFDHHTWSIRQEPLNPDRVSLADAFGLVSTGVNGRGDCTALWVEGRKFFSSLWCRSCGEHRRTLCMEGRGAGARMRCPRCRGFCLGCYFCDRLESANIPRRLLQRSLGGLGMRMGDVVSVSRGDRVVHVQFCPPSKGGES